MGNAFFLNFLLRALDLKLTISASSDLLQVLGIERDFCDLKKKFEKHSGQDATVGHINHCLILPTTCTAQGWPVSPGRQLCLGLFWIFLCFGIYMGKVNYFGICP